jgi:hypothetical protein
MCPWKGCGTTHAERGRGEVLLGFACVFFTMLIALPVVAVAGYRRNPAQPVAWMPRFALVLTGECILAYMGLRAVIDWLQYDVYGGERFAKLPWAVRDVLAPLRQGFLYAAGVACLLLLVALFRPRRPRRRPETPPDEEQKQPEDTTGPAEKSDAEKPARRA